MDPMQKKREQLKSLLGELEQAQKDIKAGKIPDQNTAEALDKKAEEAEALQKEIETYDRQMKRFRSLTEAGRKLVDPVLPDDDQPDDDDGDTKSSKGGGRPPEIIGYMKLGDFVTMQRDFDEFHRLGKPKTSFRLAHVKSLFGTRGMQQPLVPITREQYKAMRESSREWKNGAVPTLGEGVIEPTRIPEIVRATEHDRLLLRDVLDVQRTTSDAVKYTRIVSYTRAAATVAHSAQKPGATLSLATRTEPVRTVAVHMPVEEQQLDDYPQLSGIINGELLYDVNKHIEELVMYGDGEGENFSGILRDDGVLSARSYNFGGDGGDTLVDVARRGITDVRRAGYEPNAILVDPLDWEEIVLTKGTDNRYVWVVVTEGATQRLWAVPVIETVACEAFEGNAIEERNMVIGDFARGCTLWDRQDASISVGWINDQFIRNQRTILAELRAAFGVKRPGAFRKFQTQAPVSS